MMRRTKRRVLCKRVCQRNKQRTPKNNQIISNSRIDVK